MKKIKKRNRMKNAEVKELSEDWARDLNGIGHSVTPIILEKYARAIESRVRREVAAELRQLATEISAADDAWPILGEFVHGMDIAVMPSGLA